jgi:hypothetical protein
LASQDSRLAVNGQLEIADLSNLIRDTSGRFYENRFEDPQVLGKKYRCTHLRLIPLKERTQRTQRT